MEKLLLLTDGEALNRCSKIQEKMCATGMCGMLICDNANLYYLSGRVFSGFAYIPAEGKPMWFIRRPVDLDGPEVKYIRKPEEIPAHLTAGGIDFTGTVGLEFDIAPYSLILRLTDTFSGSNFANADAILRDARSVKTDFEIKQIRQSGLRHESVYRRIPGIFSPGMTDYELQVEIERLSRMEGNLGIFRISGQSMEIFMGNVLTGTNADVPTPYDFAMGGGGIDPSLPVGASGEIIKEHTTVMVDVNGNFNGYMTDMTRVFSVGEVPELALNAHQCSIDICRMFEKEAFAGADAADLYKQAVGIAESRGLEAYFMGHRQHAGFIGHGVGIEINELPVIAPRSKSVLAKNNVIALEPKFVIPGIGAVGIENTYLITDGGAESLTNAPEEIIDLTPMP